MPTNPLNVVIQHLLADLRPKDYVMTDGELIARFVRSRAEDALATLVQRHASMVWGVCRRLLDHHDAEDAFQATFLVLVRKAASVPEQTVANWLYGVARQTAIRLRATAAKRGRRETQVVTLPDQSVPEVPDADLQALDEELSRLPDHYRCVIILCDLECMTRKEAARQLGIPEGSVASRLARAREMLGKRLVRRAVATTALMAGSVPGVMTASVPSSLVVFTIKVTHMMAVGKAVAVAPSVADLTTGVAKAMSMSKMKSVVTAVLVTALCVGGACVSRPNWSVAVAQQPSVAEQPTQVALAPTLKARKPPIRPYAQFRFDGNAKNEGTGEAEFRLTNTKYTDNALELNGKYAPPSQVKQNGAYLAILEAPKMNYEQFSVAIRFKAEEFDEGKSHLFSGGAGTGRWFGLSRSANGNLVVMTNTGEFNKEIKGASLEKGKWTVVACSVDVPGQRVILALNGKKVAVIDFPKDTPLKIDLGDGSANILTFTDYSTADVFHGLVDELRLYDRALSENELEELSMDSTDTPAEKKNTVGAVPTKGDLAALEQKLVGTWINGGPGLTNIVFQADGTYHRKGGTAFPDAGSGKWKVDWSELPPTLYLSGSVYEKVFLLTLNDKALQFGYPMPVDEEKPTGVCAGGVLKKGTESDNVKIRLYILDGGVQSYLGTNGKLPPTLKTLVDAKILSPLSLVDPWGKEFKYDITAKKTGNKEVPDIWTEMPDKTTIGNWSMRSK